MFIILNRVLFYIEKEDDIDHLLKFRDELKKTYDFESKFIYVKDISRYELIPPALEGMVVDGGTNYIIQQWDEIEKEKEKNLVEKFKDLSLTEELILKDGISFEVLKEDLIAFDILVCPKAKILTNNLKMILKHHYKPLILISKKEVYNFEKIVFADNKKERANKSLFAFMNIFEPKKIEIVSVNIESENKKIEDYFHKTETKAKFVKKSGNELQEILEYPKDILIMGDLKCSFLLERITGKVGINLLEREDKPIFIG